MDEFELKAKFPELEPIPSLPSFWHFFGCGMLLRGRRGFDEETQSYIQTHCLCILGIPILAFRAYRIVDAPKGKYILGREPLSIPARAFSMFVLLAALVAGGIYGWDAYTTSPSYIARQMLTQADLLAAAGKLAESARLCREVAVGPASPAEEAALAIERIAKLLDHPAARESAPEQAGVLEVAVALRARRPLAAACRGAVQARNGGREPAC